MKKIKGFTLIELLVVIAIIALLLSIIMPSLSKAKEMAKRVICRNNLKTFGLANEIYSIEYKGSFVPFKDDTLPAGHKHWVTNTSFRDIMDAQIEKSVVSDSGYSLPAEYMCPSDKIVKDEANAFNGLVLLSYGYNLTDWGWQNIASNAVPNPVGHKFTTIKSPAMKLAFIDTIDWWVTWGSADYTRGWDNLGQASAQDYKDEGLHGPTIYRHNEGANLLFYDGHSEYQKKEDVFDIEAWEANPKVPGKWVADKSIYDKYSR